MPFVRPRIRRGMSSVGTRRGAAKPSPPCWLGEFLCVPILSALVECDERGVAGLALLRFNA